MDGYQIIEGDCLDVLRRMPSESVQCCVTSPPYFGLRDYGVDGQIGLEPTPAEFVAKMVEVFEEIRRVLKKDGTLWLNLGDSFMGGKGASGSRGSDYQAARSERGESLNKGYQTLGGQKLTRPTDIRANVANFLQPAIKGGIMFFTGRCTLTITAKRNDVLPSHNLTPDKELTRFLGVKRIVLKQRNDDFCQILNLLDSEIDILVGAGVCFSRPDHASLEIIFDAENGVGIVVTDSDLNPDTSLNVSVGPLPGHNGKTTFAVKESAEPVAESVVNVETIRDAVTLNAVSESLPNIDAVNEAISLGNAFDLSAGGLSDFRVTKASPQQFNLALMGGVVSFAIQSVGHLLVSNKFGSLIRYSQLYDQAKRISNSLQPKQEIGIPEMVKRALMEDGWICRQTIIWSKPNPMPESVTDRCTKAHEYIFLLTKSAKYFYDADAVKEPHTSSNNPRFLESRGNLQTTGARNGDRDFSGGFPYDEIGRNKRSVWTVTTQPYSEAHFATFPPKLIEPCILAGSREGDTVLDPFNGAGTTGLVSLRHRRNYIGIELNPDYIKIAEKRLSEVQVKLF